MTARMYLPDIDEKDKPNRRPIPDHIPRIEVEFCPAADACAYCGGRLRRIGEDVTDELEYVPGRFIVNRIVRPRLTCACYEKFVQSPLPSGPIERGRPGPGLLAHVLVSKYADHLPLYRQIQIFDREGLDLDRSTLADWVGKTTTLPEPLADAIGRHVLSAEVIFADDTPQHAGARHWQDPDRPALDLCQRRTTVGRHRCGRCMVSLLRRLQAPAPQGSPRLT